MYISPGVVEGAQVRGALRHVLLHEALVHGLVNAQVDVHGPIIYYYTIVLYNTIYHNTTHFI